jgi:UDP-N-acetylglucosamine 2-epimerase (non-hydrolysing)
MTVLGTRPEIVRLSLVIKLLDQVSEHILVHTGQNYVDSLDGLFFRELGVRPPDVHLGVRATGFGDQVGQMLRAIEPLFETHRPERLLILGDTNSGLTALVAKRLGIPVYHMEAGNRCYDDRVPEEVNRRAIDHASSVLMPYTNRSRENLVREGIAATRVYVVGNPISQVIDFFGKDIDRSTILSKLSLSEKSYFLVTMHRAENVDREDNLRSLVAALSLLQETYTMPVICSLHPRTRSKLEQIGIDPSATGLRFIEPFGFFDFVRLQKSAFCVLSDSGTVQEESCLLRVPNVTLREVTERPETLECGSNILSGVKPKAILDAVALVAKIPCSWQPPPEYLQPLVAETVCRLLTGFRIPEAAEIEWLEGRR